MSTKTDHHEGPSTLPEPELNPLLNPLLGQHMGRWAEVYFTSPPEKREQAVTELLHELQAENATSEGAALTSATPVQEGAPVPVFEPASEIPQAPVTSVRCHACGWENPASHRFCGMCGTPVAAQSAEDDLPTAENPQQSEPAFPPNNESPFARSKDAVYEPALSTNELSLFQGGRETSYHSEGSDNEDEMFSYSPPSRSYRVYVGIALAIVIFALAYMAWNRRLLPRLRSLQVLHRHRRARPHPHQRLTHQRELRRPTSRRPLRQTRVAPRLSQVGLSQQRKPAATN